MRSRNHAVATLLTLGAAALAASADAGDWRWRRLDPPGDERTVHAVAFDPARRRLAIGDRGGVAWRDPGERWRRRGLRGAVQDLAFAGDGSLWAATLEGLFRVARDGSVSDRSPAPGEAARDVRRVDVSAHTWAVATAGGVFLSRDGTAWRRAEGPFAAAPARAIAIGASTLWSVGAQDLARARLDATAGGSEPLPVALRPLVDVLATGSEQVALASERTLGVRAATGSGWTLLRPALPPGARVRRLASGADRVWLVTDRGLLEAPAVEGPWRRVGPPLAATPGFALVDGGDRVWVGAEDGLWEGAPLAATPVAARRVRFCDPPVRAVQRAALAHLDLEQASIRRLRRGVARRGLLPVLSLRGQRTEERTLRDEFDESFVSGGLRRLFDRDDDRSRDIDVSLTLSWDLGDLLYHPEQIDVSQEARRLVELRSDVLDEINQVYFQRRRALADAQASAPDSLDAMRHALRAEELAAGLDGWTDGWFTRALRSAECSSPR